jgi:hypothetical protein
LKGKQAIKHAKRAQGKEKRMEKLVDAVVERDPVDTIYD